MAGKPTQQIKDKGKVFRDPVHRLIRVEKEDQFILDLINTPEFQRLRRIRQLGVSSLTYHGAEHSRFVHSLGVFNFAQRIIDALQRRYGSGHRVSQHLKEHARVAKAAALLHDIGHGPFSHMIERASAKQFDHEKMTERLVTDEGSEVCSVLRQHGLDPKSVAAVIAKIFPHRLIVDIVSSQLDADRMDYLLRDSLMTGVEYGVYDAEWLLNAMCVGRDPSAPSETPAEQGWRLCLDKDRGLFAAEQLILARHHMMLQVYMHRVTRGYEMMLLNLFKRAAEVLKGTNSLPGTPKPVQAYFRQGTSMSYEDWLLFDETAMVAAIQNWTTHSDKTITVPATAFLHRKRLFAAFPIGRLSVPKAMDLQKKLISAGLKEEVDWGLDNGEHLPYKGIHWASKRPGDEEEGSTLSILLGAGDPEMKGTPIESGSGILKHFDDNQQSVQRLYVSRNRFEAALPVLKDLGIEQGGSV